MAQSDRLMTSWKYAQRIQHFKSEDWTYYIGWVGLMLGLLFAILGFMIFGNYHGVKYPDYAWSVPVGTLIFVFAIAFDTIGHRTAYKEALKNGEDLVHSITIFAGVSSCLALCIGYARPELIKFPIISLVALSIFYSVIDEAMHWFRYADGNSDRIEMWSHFFIFLGHTMMILSWYYWYSQGYPGVKETLEHISKL